MGKKVSDDINSNDVFDTIGRHMATVLIVLLGLLFAYGYLWPLI